MDDLLVILGALAKGSIYRIPMDKFQLQTENLYDASLEGNLQSLLNLLQEDPLILDRYSINKSRNLIPSPLHVSADAGHLEFTKELLSRKPELTEELEHLRKWSPLHVASGKGHLEIVKVLLSVNPNMCLARDADGLNPVHVSAIKGQVHVLDELLKVMPQAARERINAGATVLHLCVKYRQTDALIFLVNVMDDVELLNFRDGDGNTTLHLAVANKQSEMVKFLLENKRMEKNVMNAIGLTAMDIHIRSKKGTNGLEIQKHLKGAKALKAKTILHPRNKQTTRLEGQNNALMVVASLIATMAFQVGINPPGGSWQDNNGHIAGNSIMADVDERLYDMLLISSTVGLISALSVILLLISGLPCKRLFVTILMVTLWIAMTATVLSYVVSVCHLTVNGDLLSEQHQGVGLALQISIVVWLVLMVLLLLGYAINFIVKLIRLGVKLCKGVFISLSVATRRPSIVDDISK